jgi:hypothetical protein
MNTNRGVNGRIFLDETEPSIEGTTANVAPGNLEHQLNTSVPRTSDDPIAVIIECLHIEMAVGVDHECLVLSAK